MARRGNPDAHEAIVDAAREEFARRGIEGARVADIARRAGVSKGAFYLHFTSKEGAFQEILQRFLGVMAELAARREDAHCLSSREADLRAALDAECASDLELLEVLWRNRKVVAAMDASASGSTAALVLDFRRRMRALAVDRIAERQRDGTLRTDLDPHALGDLILGAYEGFGRRMIELREKPDLEAWARVFLTAFYEGTLVPRLRGQLDRRGRA